MRKCTNDTGSASYLFHDALVAKLSSERCPNCDGATNEPAKVAC